MIIQLHLYRADNFNGDTLNMSDWAVIIPGSQRGGHPHGQDHAGGGEDHSPRPQQRHRHQEGDFRRHHRVASGLQRLLTLRADLQDQVGDGVQYSTVQYSTVK